VLSQLGRYSKGFWVLLSGFLDFGCESFLGGFGNERRIKKSSNNLFLSLQKHQSFLPAKAPIFSISANTQQWKCKGKQRSIRVRMWGKLWDSL
jgi:hypothetical protein